MKPRIKLAESITPNGGAMGLYEHDGSYSINFRGQELMHSKSNVSEKLLGEIGAARIKPDADSRVLIGGLGLGFTLRRVLETTGQQTRVEVSELLPEIVAWNHQHLQALNGACLDDPRVSVNTEDVTRIIRFAPAASYDAILLDVDNGPIALVSASNVSLYSNTGVRSIRAALKPGGRAVFWSASPDLRFQNRLERAGFQVEAVPAKAYGGAKRAAYLLYVADL